ncbi:MAG: hypothetical protein ACI85O_000012 [Saprospiraceae bacterium]|jgi:hypothetical protein
MKRILTLFSFVLALSFNANAQLADGSIAPDFTATDITGVEYNLYSLLDEGKTVILDVSATWCPPCWSYHTGGTLETVWEQYGPDGTDEMYVFHIEGDASTTLADLNGTGPNTQGDWVTGVNYPIIDNASIANAYEIAYYPTLFAVCPNRTVTEIGQVSVAGHYAAVGNCPAAAGSNNGAILAYDGLEGIFCGDAAFTPSIKFQNLGDTEITTASLGLYINGTLTETVEFEGSLPTFQIADLAFSELTISEAAEIVVSVDAVNGSADDVDDYNSVTSNLNPTTLVSLSNTVNIEVTTDQYGYETYWVLRDLDGIVYAEGGNPEIGFSGGGQNASGGANGPGVLAASTTYNETVELPVDGCYEFAIYDDYGDGICCAYGAGAYSAVDANGLVIAEGGTFVNAEGTPYQANFTSSVTAIEGLTALTVSPNPTSGLANVTFGLTEANDIDVTVYNVMGQTVKTINQSFNAGVNQFQLDASNFANGVYFVNLNSAEGTSTVKFTVSK